MKVVKKKSYAPTDRWSTYEANVQAYRSCMIASQSFLLTVGAILLDKNMYLLIICVGIALFQLWFIWYSVIRTRTIIADFHKFNLVRRFSQCGNKLNRNKCHLTEDIYVKDTSVRRKVNLQLAQEEGKKELKHNLRLTRVKVDLILPITFTIMWVSLLIADYIFSKQP